MKSIDYELKYNELISTNDNELRLYNFPKKRIDTNIKTCFPEDIYNFMKERWNHPTYQKPLRHLNNLINTRKLKEDERDLIIKNIRRLTEKDFMKEMLEKEVALIGRLYSNNAHRKYITSTF